jgi:steroid delta-isomerase-like uncharacterized protein
VNPEDNKAVIRRLFASVDAHNFDPLEGDLFAPGYHLQFDSMPRMDKASAVPFFRAFVAGFPDISHTIEDMIAEGDQVGTRLLVRGTNTGEFMGMPASNRPIAISAINFFRLRDGQIIDQRLNSDGVGMMMQLGLIPGPESQGAA